MNSPGKEIAEPSIHESPQKPVLVDGLSMFNQGEDHAAQHILNDIIDADYKSLNTDQLVDLIEQNKITIRKLLKQYFAVMQKEE